MNTQFFTKMCDDKMKNALRHKFDELASSPQFIVEAKKIESEFAGHGVKLQQVHSEMLPTIERDFEEILARLNTLEKKSAARHTNIMMKINIEQVKSHRTPTGMPGNRCVVLSATNLDTLQEIVL